MNLVTCALLVASPTFDKILIVHPTNSGYRGGWSLPKGIKDEDESEAEAAARECFEETGLDLRDRVSEFIDLGRHEYVKGKDLYLFLYNKPLPSTWILCEETGEINKKMFQCNSFFLDKKGNQIAEVDRHDIVEFDKVVELLNPKQVKIIASSLTSHSLEIYRESKFKARKIA